VKAQHGAERWEQERIGEPAEELIAPVVVHDRLGHDRAEPAHAGGEPLRHLPAVQRQIGAPGALRHGWVVLAARRLFTICTMTKERKQGRTARVTMRETLTAVRENAREI